MGEAASRSRPRNAIAEAEANAGADDVPREEDAAMAARMRQWAGEWRPGSATEAALVARAARLSWEIERGERAEAAQVSRCVERARREAGEPTGWARLQDMHEIARRLIGAAPSRDDRPREGVPRIDEPSVLLRALEETPEGCRWLEEQWERIIGLIERGASWTDADRLLALGLLGKTCLDGLYEPELNALFLSWEMLDPDATAAFWRRCQPGTADADASMSEGVRWRRLVKGPANRDEARGWLTRVAYQQVARVKALRTDHDRRSEREAALRDDLAVFDAGPSLERHRRAQAARTRELHRTIELLLKLRKAGGVSNRDEWAKGLRLAIREEERPAPASPAAEPPCEAPAKPKSPDERPAASTPSPPTVPADEPAATTAPDPMAAHREWLRRRIAASLSEPTPQPRTAAKSAGSRRRRGRSRSPTQEGLRQT
jgi:hypothetical protein